MLKIKIIVVDRTRSSFLNEGEIFYRKRLQQYARIKWIEVKPARIKKGCPKEDVLKTEGRAIIQKLAPRDYLIALDRGGRQKSSEEMADWLNQLSIKVNGWLCFTIGGPLGLSKDVLECADHILSLSRLTLTHEMSRLFMVEQIYRAFTIMGGHKYHK